MGKEITIQPELSQEEMLAQIETLKLWLHDAALHPTILGLDTLFAAIASRLTVVPIVTQIDTDMTVLGVSNGILVRIPVALLSAPVEFSGNLRFNGAAVLFSGANVNFTQRSFGNLRFNGAAVLFAGANVNFTQRSFGNLRFNGAAVLFAGGHVNF